MGAAACPGQRLAEQLAEAAPVGDAGERIVARQMLDAPFRQLALGNVGDHENGALETAGLVGQRRIGHQRSEPVPVAADQFDFIAATEPAAQAGEDLLPRLASRRRPERVKRTTGQARRGSARHLRHARIHELQAEGLVGGGHAFVGEVDERRIARLAAAQRFRRAGECPRPLACGGERPGHHHEQQADEADRDKRHALVLEAGGETRQGLDHQHPLAAVERQPPGLAQGRVRAAREAGVAVVEQGLGRLFPIENAQPHAVGMAPEHARQQVVHAERAVGPPDQRAAPLGLGGDGGVVGEHRHVQQDAGLAILRRFLHRQDASRQRAAARAQRALHRFAAHRLGIHVETEGALVTPVEWLQQGNGRVRVGCAGGPHAVVRKALGAHRRDVAGECLRAHPPGEAHPLDPGMVLLQLQPPHVLAPFPAVDRFGRRIQRARAAQHLAMAAKALLDA